jgi:phosphoribosyl 1,2-cyclic phosphodiesterase
MADHTITHFPVGNGDCSRIRLTDGTQIVIDCNFTEASQREDDPTRYDVHSHLLREAKRLPGNVPHVDAFILTHADMDHCRGFAERFYTGDPARYDQRDQRRGRLLIDELWFTRRRGRLPP